jgi:hypothetical protein
MYKKFIQPVFSVFFMLFLSTPLISWVANIVPKPVYIGENRHLSVKPDLSSMRYDQWTASLDSWISDNIPFRTQFIKKYIMIWEDALSSNVRRFYKGRKDEFFNYDWNGITVGTYLGLNPLGLGNIYKVRARLAGMQAYWELRGAAYLCVMAPDKPTIYPEYLPFWAQWSRGRSIQEQYHDILTDSRINFIDLSTVLNRHKNEYKLFNKRFDTYHWNAYGLYIAYRTICEALGERIPELKPLPSGEYFEIVDRKVDEEVLGQETVPWMRLLETSALKIASNDISHISQDALADVVLNEKVNNKEVMLCFADSYFLGAHLDRLPVAKHSVMPFAHNVNTLISVHKNDSRISTMDFIAQKYHPTVVLEEFVERYSISLPFGSDNVKLMMGDVYLDSPRYVFHPQVVQRQARAQNITAELDENGELALSVGDANSYLSLPPVTADGEGRIVVMGIIQSPADMEARVQYSKGGEMALESVPLKAGDNDIYAQLFLEPNATTDLKFYFGGGGRVIFLPLPELEDIERNMRDEEENKKRFVLDKKKIDSLYFPFSELRKANRIADGKVISFARGGNSDFFIKAGFSGQEDAHRWTDGNAASLEFDVGGLAGETVTLEFDISPFVAGALKKQTARVFVNGAPYGEWSVEGSEKRELAVSADSCPNGLLTVDFKLPDAASPKKLGINEDTRKLALSFREIRCRVLRPQGESEAAE